jgi:hypothetical protein
MVVTIQTKINSFLEPMPLNQKALQKDDSLDLLKCSTRRRHFHFFLPAHADDVDDETARQTDNLRRPAAPRQCSLSVCSRVSGRGQESSFLEYQATTVARSPRLLLM